MIRYDTIIFNNDMIWFKIFDNDTVKHTTKKKTPMPNIRVSILLNFVLYSASTAPASPAGKLSMTF